MGEGKVEGSQVYEKCARMGMIYGPEMRGIEVLYRGHGEVLAKVRLPKEVEGSWREYVLHPSLMDGGVQAAVGLLEGGKEEKEPRMPYALESMRVVAECPREMYAWVRYGVGSERDDKVVKLDLDLSDVQGDVCVEMRGLSSRQLSKAFKTTVIGVRQWFFGGRGGEAGEESRGSGEGTSDGKEEEAGKTEARGLEERTQDYFRRQFSELLHLPFQRIDAQAALENYGIDSILAMKLTNQLEKTFGPLSKTLFFEYQTIAELAGYFIKAHAAIVREEIGLLQQDAVSVNRHQTPVDTSQSTSANRRKKRFVQPRRDRRKDIAIIGIGGRYPQAEDLHKFWRNLQDGRDCITEIPSERWDIERYYDPDRNKLGKSYSKWGGFIDDVDKFDPLFFNISPREADLIDPQERLFLETAWQTIEDAGYSKERMSGKRVGVFVGV